MHSDYWLDISNQQEFKNDGLINLDASSTQKATLRTSKNQFIVGRGSIRLDHPSNAIIEGPNDGTVYLSQDQRVYGAGRISGNVENDGRVYGSWSSGSPLVIDGSVVNRGSLIARNGGTLRIEGDVTNEGVISANSSQPQFGSIDINGNLKFNNPGLLESAWVGGQILVAGNMQGTAASVGAGDFLGRIVLDGTTNEELPRRVEAFGKDRGPTHNGFSNNAVVHELHVKNGNFVELTDLAENSGDGAPDVVYVDRLIVEESATLDLAGVTLYVRTSRIDGLVIGGEVQVVPDSGQIEINRLTPGSIGSSGEIDDWQFFGRAGRVFQTGVNAGTTGKYPNQSPTLGSGSVRILDSEGNVLTDVGGVPVELESDGIYTVRVQAAANQQDAVGNYFTVIWDRTTDVSQLRFNQTMRGNLESPFSEDRWTFSADAGTEVQLDILEVQGERLAFSLIGPDGWKGFQGITSDSSKISLPTAGEYEIVVEHTEAWQYDVDYSFRLDALQSRILEIGIPYQGVIGGSGSSQFFEFELTEPTMLTITLDDSTADHRNEILLKRGGPPTSRDHDYRAGSRENSDQSLTVLSAGVGKWYLRLNGIYAPEPSSFDLLVAPTSIEVDEIIPKAHGTGSDAVLTLIGAGFNAESTIELIAGDGTAYVPARISVDSQRQITATIAAESVPVGIYDVVVKSNASNTTTVAAGFEFTVGDTPQLETNLVLPKSLGYHQLATIYIEYENTGNVAMPSPLLSFSVLQKIKEFPNTNGGLRVQTPYPEYPQPYWKEIVECVGGLDNCGITITTLRNPFPDYESWETYYREFLAEHYRQDAILTLDKSRLSQGFWTSATPDGFSNTVSVLAQGKVPGLLQPGEKGRVPVYWAGWLKPWDFDYPDFEFSLTESTVEDTTPVIWDEQKDAMRPDGVLPETWDLVWPSFVERAGETWGEYTSLLNRNARYLGQLGQSDFSISDLLSLEVSHLTGGLMGLPLQQETDLALDAPGIPLAFTRTFPSDLAGRNLEGDFGFGWQHNWQLSLSEATDGTVTVSFPGSASAVYQPDVRGGYFSRPGDLLTLEKRSGDFVLSSIDGLVTRFDSNGQLKQIVDRNGNSISATYAAGRLETLQHSNGPSITFSYNADGYIGQVTDSTGRTVTYTYDSAGSNLVAVDSLLGTTSYLVATEGLAKHSIETISFPGGIDQHFSYDSLGRLQKTWTGSGSNEVLYQYGAPGKVVASATINGQVVETTYNYDHRGSLAALVDGLGNRTQFGFDSSGNRTSLQLADGTSYDYSFDARNNLSRQTNPLGQIGFDYSFQFNQLESVTDPRGNELRYEYDSLGNVTAIVYQDDSRESYTYDSRGEVASWTNRRGQSILYERSYYEDGRIELFRQTNPDGTQLNYAYSYAADLDRLVVTNENGDDAGTMSFQANTGLLTEVTYPGGYSLSYTYYPSGLRQSMLDQDGKGVKYTYDDAGRLDILFDESDELIIDYDYWVSGQLQTETRANGVVTSYQYDANGQVTDIETVDSNAVMIEHIHYSYDERGQRTSMTSSDGDWSYEYDATAQLITAEFVSHNAAIENQSHQYEYDSAGNRTRTLMNGVETEYVADDLNRYLTVGGERLKYDADGNLISHLADGVETTYIYDAESRLISVTRSGSTLAFGYDAFGNRFYKSENGEDTVYINDPIGLAALVNEYSGETSTRYTHGARLVSQTVGDGESHFYLQDALSSTTQLIDSSGLIVNQYEYAPYGERLLRDEAQPSDFEFIGGYGIADTGMGLDFMRARYYSSRSGRFISNDPIGLAGADANLQRYVANSPVDRLDPTGLIDWDLFVAKSKAFGNSLICSAATLTLSGVGTIAGGFAASACGTALGSEDVAEDTYGGVSAIERAGRCSGLHATIGHKQLNDPEIRAALGEGGCGSSGPSGANRPPRSGDARRNRGSSDPNQKSASATSLTGFQKSESEIPYRVDFENDASASAPAQVVSVTDQLSSQLDWSTFKLTELGFGDYTLQVPKDLQGFETTVVAVVDGKGLNIEVDIGINLETGEVKAWFVSLDPETSLPPDVLTGFLPPEDGTGRGQGYFSYTIQPMAGLPTGTEIRNIAEIQFDFAQIIATNQIDPHDPSKGTSPEKEALITIDAGAPSSQVRVLEADLPSAFLVEWAGEDDAQGSGIKHYDIYVSADDGPYEIWLQSVTQTAAVFLSEQDHSYSFYSVATDAVGHRELPPATPDASTNSVYYPRWNWRNALDTNDDEFISPIDALLIINHLNGIGSGSVRSFLPDKPYIDTNADNFASPIDVLLIVNYLNSLGGEGEESRPDIDFASDDSWYEYALPPFWTAWPTTALFGLNKRQDPENLGRQIDAVVDQVSRASAKVNSTLRDVSFQSLTTNQTDEAISELMLDPLEDDELALDFEWPASEDSGPLLRPR